VKYHTPAENSVLLMQFRQFASELIRLKQTVEQKYPSNKVADASPDSIGQTNAPQTSGISVERIVSPATATDQPLPGKVESENVRQSLLGILGQQSLRIQELGGTMGYGLYREAEYVMASLADEIMLNAQWSGKAHWQLLEEELFHTHASGDLFFRKIDQLISSGATASADLAMIYFQALALDFRGRYRGDDANRNIERYRRQLYSHIYQHAPEDLPKHPFFLQNYQSEIDDTGGRRLPSPQMWWLVLSGILAVWLVASTLLWKQISDTVEKHIQDTEKYSLPSRGDQP
jgi:type VI secretion system protein ImpK